MGDHSAIDRLLEARPRWLGKGTDSGIVISTRVRLARNLDDTRFPSRAEPDERMRVYARARETILQLPRARHAIMVELAELSEVDRRVLLERHLVSVEHTAGRPGAAVYVEPDEACSVMINEEDHLRLQVILPALRLREAWVTADALDSALAPRLSYAYSEQYGFLTACPTNLGTGLRASVMMHLPALRLGGHLPGTERGLAALGLAARGPFGEASAPVGDLYQISNQSTLGESEDAIISRLTRLVKQVKEHEENATRRLLERDPDTLYDFVSRSYGTLTHAYLISSDGALEALSGLRLGVRLGMFTSVDVNLVNELMLKILPGHLQRLSQAVRDQHQRDVYRAALLRRRLRRL